MSYFNKHNRPISGSVVTVLVGMLWIFIWSSNSQAGGKSINLSLNQPSVLNYTDKLIIKFREESPSRHILGAQSVPSKSIKISDRVTALSVSTSIPGMRHVRELSHGVHVLKLSGMVSLDDARQMIDQIRQDPNVEYVEPDHILHPMLAPNDTYYNLQWHYHASASEPGGVNLPAAWDIATGSADIVVAVIDTGILPHSDLNGRTVPGYDFIDNVLVANDGDGRDADPTDPGDWITAGENLGNEQGGYFTGCPKEDSTWHGTHVAGTVGAVTNNNTGVAGVNWVSKILPVRVLGKCGGYLSDIIDGMRWSAGLSVAGVPANANPADVLNLSLAGTFSCSIAYQNAIDEIVTAGKLIVVAAGNDNDDAANYSPASCNNVITVSANNRAGGLASYSNYGAVVDITAPGGDTPHNPNGVASTLDSGLTTAANDNIYVYFMGTSMAAPHVAGIASLMLSANDALTGSKMSPSLVMQKIQDNARAFPTGTGSDCTTSTCGPGIIDAAAAVQAVTTAPTADAGIDQTVDAGDPVDLDGSASSDDGSIVSYAWLQTVGTSVSLNNGNTATPDFTAPAAADVLTFQLSVTDDVGITVTDSVDITVNSTNAVPVAGVGSLTTDEDTVGGGTLTATDADGDGLSYIIVSNGTKGTAVVTDVNTGAYSYTPNANANGADSFTFKVNDGYVDSNTATITVTIDSVNDIPAADDDTLATNEDFSAGDILNATDADGDSLTYSIVSNGIKGTAVITNVNTGAYTYLPNANANGADNFTFKVNDGYVDSNTATVSIMINAVNDPPVANDDTLVTDENTTADGILNADDIDDDNLTYSIVSDATQGTVVITDANTGAYTYTPNADATGSDSFTYKVNDGSADSNAATITVTINASGDVQILTASASTTAAGGGGAIGPVFFIYGIIALAVFIRRHQISHKSLFNKNNI